MQVFVLGATPSFIIIFFSPVSWKVLFKVEVGLGYVDSSFVYQNVDIN